MSRRCDAATARISRLSRRKNVAPRRILAHAQATFFTTWASREKRPGPQESHLRESRELKWIPVAPQRFSRIAQVVKNVACAYTTVHLGAGFLGETRGSMTKRNGSRAILTDRRVTKSVMQIATFPQTAWGRGAIVPCMYTIYMGRYASG